MERCLLMFGLTHLSDAAKLKDGFFAFKEQLYQLETSRIAKSLKNEQPLSPGRHRIMLLSFARFCATYVLLLQGPTIRQNYYTNTSLYKHIGKCNYSMLTVRLPLVIGDLTFAFVCSIYGNVTPFTTQHPDSSSTLSMCSRKVNQDCWSIFPWTGWLRLA